MSNRSRGSRWRRIVLSACVAVAAAVAPIAAVVPAAQAAPVVGFNAGNIISDSLFYNGSAMSAAEVQTFLSSKLATCRIGTPGYMPGDPSPSGSGNIIASNCLKDFRQTTSSRSADRYCQGYVGVPNETAAQIIAKVGLSCGISPKVLLVMLEKEQSLVTDSWPVTRQYNYALGMNCPDSGPNNSANCDAESAGFALQLYLGARQLQVYKGNPGSFNFQPGRYNTIQWHPNAGCGTSQVYIENWATASLYIYTPYRPNQAALNAGWGTGDACSSYGNRNFFNFYSSWFGSTAGFNVWGDIGLYWNARGGASSQYGYPTSNSTLRSTKFENGSWVQTFAGGVITTEMKTGKTVGIPYGRVYDHWNLVDGGVFGIMGAAVSEPASYSANGGGVLQWFQGGLMVTATQQGTVASLPYGGVYDLYNNELNGIYGELGYPTSSLSSYTGGQLQNFQNGFISRAKGSSTLVPVTRTGFFDYFNGVAGGIYGKLGFPVAPLVVDGNGIKSQEFVGGMLMQSPGGSVIEVSGPTFAAYLEATRNGVTLGAPTAGEQSITTAGGATYTPFQSGLVVTPKITGKTAAIGGAIYTHYNSVLGGFGGAFGYPTANQRDFVADGGGALQTFQNGLVITSQEAGTVAALRTEGPIYERYNGVEGGIYGWLGVPVADEVQLPNGSRSQKFHNGGIVVDASGRITVLPTAAYDLYATLSGTPRALGVQVSPTRNYDVQGGASLSFFANGLITVLNSSGAAASLQYSSPIYARYNGVEGGIFGYLGLPISEESTTAGISSQKFQFGVIGTEANGSVVAAPEKSYLEYRAQGGAGGALGAQTSSSRRYAASGGAWLSFFAGGLVVQTEAGAGSVATMKYGSPIYEFYNSMAGGIYGSLGYPIANEVTQNGVTTQRFQNGTLSYANGAVTRN